MNFKFGDGRLQSNKRWPHEENKNRKVDRERKVLDHPQARVHSIGEAVVVSLAVLPAAQSLMQPASAASSWCRIPDLYFRILVFLFLLFRTVDFLWFTLFVWLYCFFKRLLSDDSFFVCQCKLNVLFDSILWFGAHFLLHFFKNHVDDKHVFDQTFGYPPDVTFGC